MCDCNLGYQAVLARHTALFITAGSLLGELAALDSDSALRSRLRKFAARDLLLIDEVGYLSYSNRHADLLFEAGQPALPAQDHGGDHHRALAEWGEVFTNATCEVSLIDRLMHRAEVIRIEGGSYRAKETAQRSAQRQVERAAKAPATRARKAAPWSAQMPPIPPSPPGGRVKSPPSSPIPQHWTPEQALAVFERLQALREALWQVYGPQVQQAWREQLMQGTSPKFDPDEPF